MKDVEQLCCSGYKEAIGMRKNYNNLQNLGKHSVSVYY